MGPGHLPHHIIADQNALKDKRLQVNSNALVTPGYTPPKGEGPLPTYEPCSSLAPSG